jgi:hypothetical protein
MAGSPVTKTVNDVLDEMNLIYLDDKDNVIYSEQSKFYAINRAMEEIQMDVALHDETYLLASDSISYDGSTVEYTLTTSAFMFPYRLRYASGSGVVTMPPIAYYEDDDNVEGWYVKGQGTIGIRHNGGAKTMTLDYVKARNGLETQLADATLLPDIWTLMVAPTAAMILKGPKGVSVEAEMRELARLKDKLIMVSHKRDTDMTQIGNIQDY